MGVGANLHWLIKNYNISENAYPPYKTRAALAQSNHSAIQFLKNSELERVN